MQLLMLYKVIHRIRTNRTISGYRHLYPLNVFIVWLFYGMGIPLKSFTSIAAFVCIGIVTGELSSRPVIMTVWTHRNYIWSYVKFSDKLNATFFTIIRPVSVLFSPCDPNTFFRIDQVTDIHNGCEYG